MGVAWFQAVGAIRRERDRSQLRLGSAVRWAGRTLGARSQTKTSRLEG